MSGESYERSRRRATDATDDGVIRSLGRVPLRVPLRVLLPVDASLRAASAVPSASSTAAHVPHFVTALDTMERRLESVL